VLGVFGWFCGVDLGQYIVFTEALL